MGVDYDGAPWGVLGVCAAIGAVIGLVLYWKTIFSWKYVKLSLIPSTDLKSGTSLLVLLQPTVITILSTTVLSGVTDLRYFSTTTILVLSYLLAVIAAVGAAIMTINTNGGRVTSFQLCLSEAISMWAFWTFLSESGLLVIGLYNAERLRYEGMALCITLLVVVAVAATYSEGRRLNSIAQPTHADVVAALQSCHVTLGDNLLVAIANGERVAASLVDADSLKTIVVWIRTELRARLSNDTWDRLPAVLAGADPAGGAAGLAYTDHTRIVRESSIPHIADAPISDAVQNSVQTGFELVRDLLRLIETSEHRAATIRAVYHMQAAAQAIRAQYPDRPKPEKPDPVPITGVASAADQKVSFSFPPVGAAPAVPVPDGRDTDCVVVAAEYVLKGLYHRLYSTGAFRKPGAFQQTAEDRKVRKLDVNKPIPPATELIVFKGISGPSSGGVRPPPPAGGAVALDPVIVISIPAPAVDQQQQQQQQQRSVQVTSF